MCCEEESMVLVVSITVTLPSSTNTFLHLLSPQHPASPSKTKNPSCRMMLVLLVLVLGTTSHYLYHTTHTAITHTQSNQQSRRRHFPAWLCSSSTLLFLHLTSSHQPRATFETRNRTTNNEPYQTRFLHSILSSRLLLLLPTGSLQ